jgi:hypothetical protein
VKVIFLRHGEPFIEQEESEKKNWDREDEVAAWAPFVNNESEELELSRRSSSGSRSGLSWL